MAEPKNLLDVALPPRVVATPYDRPFRGTAKPGRTMSTKKPTVHADLEQLQHESFNYLWLETNPANGLVLDKTASDWPASIAATALALAAYPVAVERGFIPRSTAAEQTRTPRDIGVELRLETNVTGIEVDGGGYRVHPEAPGGTEVSEGGPRDARCRACAEYERVRSSRTRVPRDSTRNCTSAYNGPGPADGPRATR